MNSRRIVPWIVSQRSLGVAFALLLAPLAVFAHGVAEGDAQFLERIQGTHLIPYMYLGAKHMVTGYDHLLFLAGVIFFLYRLKDVALYVTSLRSGTARRYCSGCSPAFVPMLRALVTLGRQPFLRRRVSGCATGG